VETEVVDPAAGGAGLASGPVVIIGAGYGRALLDELTRRDIQAELVEIPSELPAERGGELDDVAEQLSIINQKPSAIVHLAALERSGDEVDYGLLDGVQRFQTQLQESAAAGGAAVLGVTRMGGAFGFDHRPDELDPWQGLVTGFCKSLAHEWPTVRVRAVDLDARSETEAATILADELLTADNRIEVGHVGQQRLSPTLIPAADPGEADAAELGIDEGDVVLVTGGARGITATVARSIAGRKPILVLLGRTELEDEDPAFDGLDGADLRRALMAKRKEAGQDASLKAVNGDFDRIDRNRQVRANLDLLTAGGATVEYLVCDMRNGSSVATAVKDVRTRHGKIDGVIHGAGIIEDKLIADKTQESYQRVIGTKAHGVMNLLAALDFDETKLVVLFSSVSGRFGNAGQTDYAAASEVLNKLSQKLLASTSAKVTAINWGPWLSGGMVTPQIEKQFAERGVKLIRPDVGCQMFADELLAWSSDHGEVVVGGADGLTPEEPSPKLVDSQLALLQGLDSVTKNGDTLEVIRKMNLDLDPYLSDHRLDGIPVVPFMSCTELMGSAASLAAPELPVRKITDVLLNKGFMLAPDAGYECTLRALVSPSEVKPEVPGEVVVDVTLDPGALDKRYNYTGTAHLSPRRKPVPLPEPLSMPRPFPYSVDYCYEEILFHGPTFARLTEIRSLGEHGMSAMMRATKPQGNIGHIDDEVTWLFDPICLDASLQALVIFARVVLGVTPLPTRMASLELFHDGPGVVGTNEEVDVQLEMRRGPDTSRNRLIADLYFIVDGEVRALVSDFQGYGSSALNRLAKA
jgi:NAD(P)-dependent dehydrogenase (short-subunit alcohol dehydrogenase family)